VKSWLGFVGIRVIVALIPLFFATSLGSPA